VVVTPSGESKAAAGLASVKRNRFIVLENPNVIGIIYHLVEGP
jgi:hypothetical protein